MKVTALIPDELVEEVKKISGGKNITESLIIALKSYVKNDRMDKLINDVENNPLTFDDQFLSRYRDRSR